MPFYSHKQKKNYYFDQGNGDVVLLLHGITNSGRAFVPQAIALLNAGYRVIVPDHAGHGASANIKQTCSVSEIASDTLGLIEHLALSNITVIGVSLGGMVALELLAEHSPLFAKGLIANSFAECTNPGVRKMAALWEEIFNSPDGPALRFEQTWTSLVSDEFRNSDVGMSVYQSWQAQAASADGESLAYIARGIVGFDIRERLAQISHPVLIISGEYDQISPVSNSVYLQKHLPNAKHVTINGAAHLPNVDSARVFNRYMLAFLKE